MSEQKPHGFPDDYCSRPADFEAVLRTYPDRERLDVGGFNTHIFRNACVALKNESGMTIDYRVRKNDQGVFVITILGGSA